MTPDQPLGQLNLQAWVERASPQQRSFREAVHIVISAISASTALRSQMVMKGGLLLAIRYDSTRFTRDADFSTREKYRAGEETALLNELDQRLEHFNNALAYDTMCRRQRARMNPPKADSTYPSLNVGIGYAIRSDAGMLRRLLAGQSPHVVEIDYSYNEAVLDTEVLRLSDGLELTAYSHLNVIAEKLRSLLQQPTRRRNRRQDVYDLYLLFRNGVVPTTPDEASRLVKLLLQSCAERGIKATDSSIFDGTVRDMAAKDYEALADEIEEDLPDFEEAYTAVCAIYSSLPWGK